MVRKDAQESGKPAAKAKGTIIAGTTILEEEPFAHALFTKFRTTRCDWCYTGGNLKPCLDCNFCHYCSPECQGAAWGAYHKIECAHLKALPTARDLPDGAHLLARIIWKLNAGGDYQRGYYAKKEFRTFKDLMHHTGNLIYDEERMQHFEVICKFINLMMAEKHIPPLPILLQLYGKICVNAFNITDEDMCSIGSGIYLGASICDHSCLPNAVASFNGTTLSIRLLDDLPGPKLDWSKVFISYVDLMQPTEERLEDIFKRYYFICKCPRCEDHEETKKMLAAKCPKESCNCALDLRTPLNKCHDCETEIPEEHTEMYHYVMSTTQEKLFEMKEWGTGYLDILTILEKLQRNVLHTHNIWRIKTLEAAFDSASNLERLDEAVAYSKELIDGFKRWNGSIYPAVAVVYMKIGKVALKQGDVYESLSLLREASEILKITHGEEHPVYKKLLTPWLNHVTNIVERRDAAAAARAEADAAAAAAKK